MIDLKNQFAGNGDQNPNPGEDAAHTAQTHANEGDVAVQSAQVDAMWAAYNAERSAEAAELKAKWLEAEILDGNLPRGNVEGNKPDDKPDDEDPDTEDPDDEDPDDEAAQVAFDAAATANLARKSAGAQRRRNDSKAVKRNGRNLRGGLIDHKTVGMFLHNNPAGTQKDGKSKKIVGGTDGRRVEVKLTPDNEVFKQNTTPFGKKPVQKPKGYENPMYMREEDSPPMEFVPIPADDGGITEPINAD